MVDRDHVFLLGRAPGPARPRTLPEPGESVSASGPARCAARLWYRRASMHTAEVTFRVRGQVDPQVCDEATEALLRAWASNGQLVGSWHRVRAGELLAAFVAIPDADSLSSKFESPTVRRAGSRVAAARIAGPEVRILGPQPQTETPCRCARWESLVLYAGEFSTAPPLRCGSCFSPIPLYRVPPTCEDGFDDVLSWEADYRACDRLQSGSATGSRFGVRQLAEHESPLSREGRDLAARIESAIRVPVFYFLFRPPSKKPEAELRRTCPGCGGEWRLEQPRSGRFDFECRGCRLLSNLGCAVP